MHATWSAALVVLLTAGPLNSSKGHTNELLIIVENRGSPDGYRRFIRSAELAGAEVVTPPDGSAGRGHEVSRLREELERRDDHRQLSLVLAGAASDVIVSGTATEIAAAFRLHKARVLFSADARCWPDGGLADRYPSTDGYRFINSAAYMGSVRHLLTMLSDPVLADSDGGQEDFTRLYLDKALRQKYGIQLDEHAAVFQSLTGAHEDVVTRYRGKSSFLQQLKYSTVPMVVHAEAESRQYLNTLGNYLADAWRPHGGCAACWDHHETLSNKPESFPRVFLALFIERPTPFLEEFFDNIRELIYPKRKLDLWMYSGSAHHADTARQFVDKFGDVYGSAHLLPHGEHVGAMAARTRAIQSGLETEAEFFLFVDATAHINNPYTLKLLIEQNRDVVAPLLVHTYSIRSNFDLGLDSSAQTGSVEYKAIASGKRKGLWNVAFVSECYLVKRTVLEDEKTRPDFSQPDDVASGPHFVFSSTLTQADKFLFVSNRVEFGHLVDPTDFVTSRLHNELWQMEANRWDWEQRYLHPNFSSALDPQLPVEAPCPDVFWVPLVTGRFCEEMIDTMEDYGKWSGGGNDDPRISGGYESVPTRDIHMKQVSLERQWLAVLRDYVQRVQERVFIGYHSHPPQAALNFVVRYKPNEQPALEPHHDASTYTINMALNTPGVDYEGGGCRFVRQNCSVTGTKRGWLLMHPGRLTHYHEGLPTTRGTRYILVSFVDP